MKIKEYAAVKLVPEAKKPYFIYLIGIAPKGRSLGFSFHILTQMLVKEFPELTDSRAARILGKYFNWERDL